MSSILSDILSPPQGKTAEISIKAPRKKQKQRSPQEIIDNFWDGFTTKKPGKATSIIPQNAYAEKAAKRSIKRLNAPAQTTQASFEEAAAICRGKVAKIVKECRRINQKYRDPHFDLEADLKMGRRDCLESLDNTRDEDKSSRKDDRDRPETITTRVGTASAPDAASLPPILRPTPNGDTDSMFRPMSVKRVVDIFDAPQFYIDGPTANDVRQGRDGDCWLMAALCTLSNKPGLIERICVAHEQAVGVYGFVFHRDGEWISEIIDDKLYLTKPDYDEVNLERILWEDRERLNSEESYRKIYQSNSGALYFAQCENPNETWLPLLEKAYAKAHGDYAAIEGGFTGEGIEDLTGGMTSEIYTTDILDKEYFWKEELLKVNVEFLFGCSTGVWGRGWGERKGIVELHAYSVLKAVETDGMRLVMLKNPWGKHEWKGAWSDGSKEWTPEWLQRLDHRFGDDGAFWISYEDLLRKYQAFDRTRLFGDDWKVASIWTTLTVPWTLGYNDTRFAFTVSRPGPVVLALSQLDERYFRGLEGQYRFELSFRLHREDDEDEDDYVVRSQTAYRMNRSVNVELSDLPAGAYTVLVKIDVQRDKSLFPPEKVVRASAKTRREKLIRTGLAYDTAHGKGKIIETEEEKKAREAAEKRRRDKAREEMRKEWMDIQRREHYLDVKHLAKKRKRAAKLKAKKEAKAEKRREEREKRRKEEEEAREKEEQERLSETQVRMKKRVGGNVNDAARQDTGKESESPEKSEKEAGIDVPPTELDNADPHVSPNAGRPTEAGAKVEEAEVKKAQKGSGGEDKPAAIEDHGDDSSSPSQGTPAATTASDKSTSEKGDKQAHAVRQNGPPLKMAHSETVEPDSTLDQETRPETTDGDTAQHQEGDDKVVLKTSPTEAPAKGKDDLATADETETPKPEAQQDILTTPVPDAAETTDSVSVASKTDHSKLLKPAKHIDIGVQADVPEWFDADDEYVHIPGGSPFDGPHHPPHHSLRDMMPPPHRPRGPPVPGRGPRHHHHNHPPPPPPPHSGGRPRLNSHSSFDSIGAASEDFDSLSEVSDMSETELDYHFNKQEEREAQNRAAGSTLGVGGNLGVGSNSLPPPPLFDARHERDDDFEKDPWNAVAVVGLRVYYKVLEGEAEDVEVVKMGIVRPNPFLVEDEGEDLGKKKVEEEEKEMDKAMVLDVDDPQKDATGTSDELKVEGEKEAEKEQAAEETAKEAGGQDESKPTEDKASSDIKPESPEPSTSAVVNACENGAGEEVVPGEEMNTKKESENGVEGSQQDEKAK